MKTYEDVSKLLKGKFPLNDDVNLLNDLVSEPSIFNLFSKQRYSKLLVILENNKNKEIDYVDKLIEELHEKKHEMHIEMFLRSCVFNISKIHKTNSQKEQINLALARAKDLKNLNSGSRQSIQIVKKNNPINEIKYVNFEDIDNALGAQNEQDALVHLERAFGIDAKIDFEKTLRLFELTSKQNKKLIKGTFETLEKRIKDSVAGTGPNERNYFLPVIAIAILILLIILVLIVMFVPDFGRNGCDNFDGGIGSSKMATRGYYQGDFKSDDEGENDCDC